jgi:formylmethanofuran dehydrogenase subunit A
MGSLAIVGGRVVDPANDVDAVVDLWVEDGRIAPWPADPGARADRTIDARGDVVMPGGVDVHCHIVGSKVNAARAMRPEDKDTGEPVPRPAGGRRGARGHLPTTFATGYLYAGMGYTTAVDAAIAAFGARHAHHELGDTPILDTAFLVLVGNDHNTLRRVGPADRGALRDYLGWLLHATRGYGLKVVNPGGVERWKQGAGTVAALDDEIPGFKTTPRAILTAIAETAEALGLPHAMHLHGLNLGLPGNAATTLETLRALDGRRAHLAHIQFHSYSGEPGSTSTIGSGVAALAEHINTHPGLTLDVGQVLPGETTAMTADGAVGQYLAQLTGRKWISHDVELETGCGVVPITYDDRNLVHALQFAIGLEWYLRVEDPWRIAMSTDHPNGAAFLAYPRILALLMERARRQEVLGRLPAGVRERCPLHELDREYSLREIAIITRAAPARILGLEHKGHLGVGADADVTIYRPDADIERMFERPRYVMHRGQVIVDDGDIVVAPDGRTLHVTPGYDPGVEAEVARWFDRYASLQFGNFAMRDAELRPGRLIAMGPRP